MRFDFLSRRGPHRRWRRPSLVIAGSLAGCLLLLTIAIVPFAVRTARAARAAQAELTAGQRALASQQFDRARAAFAEAGASLDRARAAYRPIRVWRWVPLLGPNVRAGDQLLEIGQRGIRTVDRLTSFADQLLTPLAARGSDLTYGGLSVAERNALLTNLGGSEATLARLNDDVTQLLEKFNALPKSFLTRRFERELTPIRDGLTLANEALARAAPIARVLPQLLGHGSEKTYLFLLQNSAELRPSGGFIGTYGILNVHDGSVTSFATDNSYNLDDRVKGTLRIPPPEPLRKYNDVRNWFFRDSNWSPDFQEAATTAADFYRREGGRERLDGVLGVTPDFVGALLDLTGPITVDGIEFTSDNLVDSLQEEVTYGFAQRGVTLSARKGIIGRMGKTLLDRLFALPQREWGDLWKVLLTALNQKDVQLAFTNAELQTFAEEQRWAGRVNRPEHDALMVVDANLASLKTDPVVERSLRYELDATVTPPQATLIVTYANRGTFTKKTTRYRTFVRVYVPAGATLTSSEGTDLTDRSDRPGTVETGTELDRTVFGAFKSVEPGQTESLTFRYTLPANIQAALNAGDYRLDLQKQAGTGSPGAALVFIFSKPARLLEPLDSDGSGRHTRHELTTDRRIDRTFRFRIEQ